MIVLRTAGNRRRIWRTALSFYGLISSHRGFDFLLFSFMCLPETAKTLEGGWL